eukprot:6205718-Pleurochrysis_carterae.AAC.5
MPLRTSVRRRASLARMKCVHKHRRLTAECAVPPSDMLKSGLKSAPLPLNYLQFDDDLSFKAKREYTAAACAQKEGSLIGRIENRTLWMRKRELLAGSDAQHGATVRMLHNDEGEEKLFLAPCR